MPSRRLIGPSGCKWPQRQCLRSLDRIAQCGIYPGLSIEQLKQATQLGAYLEFVWSGAQGSWLAHWIRAIRAATPQWVLISSDLGQPNNPLHPDGLLELYRTLKGQGFSDGEVAQMSSDGAGSARNSQSVLPNEAR